jgi:ATP-dependent phosphofructokinase / diphosphate-dependent phosphofructokinase
VPRTIALMTGGGDCPGLNAAIRAVTRVATDEYGWKVVGILDGFEGLIEGRYRALSTGDVRGIMRVGGTILGSSNRTNPFKYIAPGADQAVDASEIAAETLRTVGADALVVIGGDGTLALAHRFANERIPIVGIPKTIDNDVHGTDFAIGFDSCVATVADAVDKLHTTAESHHRVMLVEVMGRSAGWVALYSAIAGGADIALIPERGYEIDDLVEVIEKRRSAGRYFTIAVVSEGVLAPSGELTYRSTSGDQMQWKLGGVCHAVAEQLAHASDREVRAIVLGHLQRGGSPTPTDRILATRLAYAAVEAVKSDHTGVMAGINGDRVELVPLSDVAVGPRVVPKDHSLLAAADAIGIFVGG